MNYSSSKFKRISTDLYDAVLSAPEGATLSNDLSIPFVVKKGCLYESTPCYGGEQYESSLYSEESMPIPFCEKLNKSIKWKSISFLFKNSLWIISPLGMMRRSYVFNEQSIDIRTWILSPFKFRHIYLLLKKGSVNIRSTKKLRLDGVAYSASGELTKFTHTGAQSSISLDFSL